MTLGPRVGEIASSMGKPPMPHQQYIWDVALEIDPLTGLFAYSNITVVGPRQVTGKALDRITPMLTTRGWVPLSEIRSGDYVYHPDGHPTLVLFATDEMTDHECYRVTTSDGRTIVADADHLWQVKDTISGTRAWKVKTTAEIASAGLRNRGDGGWRWRLPIQREIKSPPVALPLDPYFLGYWLGDGTTANSSLTVGTVDLDHVREQVVAAGLTVHSQKQDARTGAWALWISSTAPGFAKPLARLRRLGLLGNKHVPDAYLYAGRDQRLSLLQGLMDSDGSIDKRQGSVEFCSTRKGLADAVLYLARSLGWRAGSSESDATLSGRVVGRRWRVTWTPAADDPNPFRLERKAKWVKQRDVKRPERTSAVSIAAVEPVASRPVRCIKVDSPDGLFLAGRDLVATHNTELILPAMIHRCTGVGHELVEFAMREYGLKVPEPGAQRVFFTAQTADDARTRWRDTHVDRIRHSVMRELWSQPPRLTQNKESMFWSNGSSWVPGSTTGKTAGTGDTIDMGVIDEAWSRPDNRTEMGMRPAMLTRPWSQLWALSMIPGPSKVGPDDWPWLKQRIEAGRQRIRNDVRRGSALFEFSAADKIEEINAGDPDVWWRCMPGLGYTVPEDRVRDDFEDMPLADFAAEYLGVFPTRQASAWETISKPTWSGLRVPYADVQEPIALGIDANPNLSTGTISMAGRMPDGQDVYVEMIDRHGGVNWLISAVLAIARVRAVCAVGIDRNGPLAGLIVPLSRAAIEENVDLTIEAMQSPEVNAACATFYNMTGGIEDDDPGAATTRRVRHSGQPELDQSVGGLIRHRHGDRWSWHRTDSTADTGPVFAATLALAAGEAQEWIGGAYDVMESLG